MSAAPQNLADDAADRLKRLWTDTQSAAEPPPEVFAIPDDVREAIDRSVDSSTKS